MVTPLVRDDWQHWQLDHGPWTGSAIARTEVSFIDNTAQQTTVDSKKVRNKQKSR